MPDVQHTGPSPTPPAPLIAGLLRPGSYDHPVGKIELIETHISWVILTGEFAYKIKKPVNLGFLDFSTLAKRRFYCEEEVRLNRRLTTDMYRGVVGIARRGDSFALAGADDPAVVENFAG